MDKKILTAGQISTLGPPENEDTPQWASGFLRALGYLLVQSNYLEDSFVDLYLIVTGKLWGEVRETIRGKTLGQLSQLAIEAYEKRFPDGDMRKRLDDLRPTLARAIETRNAFVHASWAFDDAKQQMERTRLPRMKKAGHELLQMKAADVEAAITIVGGAAERVSEELFDAVDNLEHLASS